MKKGCVPFSGASGPGIPLGHSREAGSMTSTSTASTRAIGGPTCSHAISASSASGAPAAWTITEPSGQFSARPRRPRVVARSAVLARNHTPWTRPRTQARRAASGDGAGKFGSSEVDLANAQFAGVSGPPSPSRYCRQKSSRQIELQTAS